MRLPLLACAATLTAFACRSGDGSAGTVGDSAVPGPTVAAAPAPPTTPAPGAPAAAPGEWQVTEYGLGPLRAGMSLAEAGTALGRPLVAPESARAPGCSYAMLEGAPAGVRVMVGGGRVARVEVDSATVATAAGARVGDSEASVQGRYPGRVVVQPHKYTEGHYLVVTPAAPADSNFRLIFETEQGRVTRYRAGRRPEVEYVEGCS
jgi:hypothetical protein